MVDLLSGFMAGCMLLLNVMNKLRQVLFPLLPLMQNFQRCPSSGLKTLDSVHQ